ncbi:NAD(P)-dependent oxidoreductase [Listeria immobilis]|uniref:NAD(P)-dependent oxidoreductase n=1 Tax=Listeria immobilis TaxID=2713502 RepID=UPI00164E3DA0|nr:NAD(P)H-binding protein [Listeria immobilis]MBC6302736.1 NAD(P)H-binding protein [Listeria immobilis]
MKIAIFGATGGIGKFVVQHALERGFIVNAYVRNADKVTIHHPNLEIHTGELTNYLKIKAALSGCDVVIWCVGIPMKKYVGTVSLDGHKILLQAMVECGIKRLIDWGTPSIPFKKDKKSFTTIFPSLIAGIALKQAKTEMLSIARLITASTVEWTIVRFIAPKNSPYKGNIKTSYGDSKLKWSISREDIAVFILDQVTSKKYIYSMPIIGT